MTAYCASVLLQIMPISCHFRSMRPQLYMYRKARKSTSFDFSRVSVTTVSPRSLRDRDSYNNINVGVASNFNCCYTPFTRRSWLDDRLVEHSSSVQYANDTQVYTGR